MFNQSGRPTDCSWFPLPALWPKPFLQAIIWDYLRACTVVIVFPHNPISQELLSFNALLPIVLKVFGPYIFPLFLKDVSGRTINPICYSILAEARMKGGFFLP